MKIAGGVLLIVFGAWGMVVNLFIASVGAVASGMGRAGASAAGNSEDLANAQAVSDLGDTVAAYGTVVGLIAILLLVMGIVTLASKKMWPGVTALILAVVYTFIPPMNIITGIGLILGGILATLGAQKAANSGAVAG